MNEGVYKYAILVVAVLGTAGTLYGAYLDHVAPDSLEEWIGQARIEGETDFREVAGDLNRAQTALISRAKARGIKNVAVPPRLDEPVQIQKNASAAFDLDDAATVTIGVTAVSRSYAYVKLEGRGLRAEAGSKLDISLREGCAIHVAEIDHDAQAISVRAICNTPAGG